MTKLDKKDKRQVGEARVVDYTALKSISEKVSLADIQVTSFAANALRSLSGLQASDLEQKIGVRGRLVHASETTAIVLIEFNYTAEQDKDQVAQVQGTLIVFYAMASGSSWEEFQKEIVEQFAEVNGIYNTWSYIRELVASSLTRLGLAGVLLPLWRPPKELPPRGEFAELKYSPAVTKSEVADNNE